MYAAYQDARITDLKLSCGYLPVVALTDPAAGNVSPGMAQAPASPKGRKGKGIGGKKGKSKSTATFKYAKPAAKGVDPEGRAKAAIICLRCGQPGHMAATCSAPRQGQKRSAPTESVARCEEDEKAMVLRWH